MSAETWPTVRVSALQHRAAVIEALFALGAQGVQELEHEVVTSLPHASRDDVTQRVRLADAQAAIAFESTPLLDWDAEWKARLRAHHVGSQVIAPPWLANGYDPRKCVVIEPGMAFGTGEHETTRSALRLLQKVVRGGDRVVDLGSGSAVLAIAAAKLGAARVVAVEVDPEAMGNAAANVQLNGVGDRVALLEGDAATMLPLVAPARVLLANIVSSVLVELLPAMRQALTADGKGILSGILVEERPAMEAAISAAGFQIVDSETDGMWWTVAIAPA